MNHSSPVYFQKMIMVATGMINSPILYQQKQWNNISVTEYQQDIGYVEYPQSSEYGLYLLLSNQPALLSRTLDGETAYGTYNAGDIAFLSIGSTMCDQWESSGHCLKIQLSSSFLQQLAHDVLGPTETLKFVPVLKRQDPELLSIGKMLLMAMNQDLPGEARYVEMLAELLSMHLIRGYSTQCPAQEPRIGLAKYQIEIIKNYIGEHLQDEIRLPELADVLGMSPFHFSRIFKQTMDISPYQYVIRQRIEKVKVLLQDQQISLIDVSLETGFSSQSHMGTCFKQITGMTPKVYRNCCHTSRVLKHRDFALQQQVAGA